MNDLQKIIKNLNPSCWLDSTCVNGMGIAQPSNETVGVIPVNIGTKSDITLINVGVGGTFYTDGGFSNFPYLRINKDILPNMEGTVTSRQSNIVIGRDENNGFNPNVDRDFIGFNPIGIVRFHPTIHPSGINTTFTHSKMIKGGNMSSITTNATSLMNINFGAGINSQNLTSLTDYRLYEYMYWNRALLDDEIRKVQSYIKQKYNI
ncbi:hypothetical protein [Pedobacter sp. ASV28]|uniref:hypothetical protein n=1 Tax=Pedobacter sp. ASV28 TaxID=2795123 RepID=UPI0018ED4154|nr:hypothetical protein [Pedobacter sp. ASV28]